MVGENVWNNWNTCTDTGTSYDATACDTIWYQWVKGPADTFEPVKMIRYESSRIELTPKELREAQALRHTREEEARKFRIIEKEKRDKAEYVALELLEELIGPEERKIYEETGRVMVKGKKADYIINRGTGVTRVEKDKIIDLCIHLKEKWKYPETDNVIALALLAAGNEDKFNKMANVMDLDSRPFVPPKCANGFGD